MSRPVYVLGTLAMLAACTVSAGPGSGGEASQDAIVRGEPSGADQDAVVRLVIGAADGEVCTGTLIAPNAVLTARHCIALRSTETVRPTCRVQGSGGASAETTPDRRYVGNVDVTTVEVTVGAILQPGAGPAARGLELFTDESDTMCGHDVAVIVLDREITIAAPREVRKTAPLATEELTAVGWGFTEATTVNGARVLPTNRMQRSKVMMLGAAGEIIEYRRSSGAVIIAGAMAGEFLVGESVCNGDSGGPLFDRTGQIVGITSRRVNMTSLRCVDSPIVFSHPGSAVHEGVIDAALTRARVLRGQ